MRLKFYFLISIFLLFQLLSAKVGLVLSGGGARGISHIGVLKVLDELNVQIDYITGTSIGAIIGALYAQGYSADQIEEIILNNNYEDVLDDNIKREDLYIGEKRWLKHSNYHFKLNNKLIPSLPRSFFQGNRLTNKLYEYYFPSIEYSTFDSLNIPFRAIAVDIVSGEEKVFDSGSLHEAIRASLSVPSIIAPFELENHIYIDGGVRANFPTKLARGLGADYIIGVRVNTGLKPEEDLNTLLEIYDQTVNIGISDNVENSIQYCDLLIEPDLVEISSLDFKKKISIIQIGENEARKFITSLDSLPKRKQVQTNSVLEISFDKIQVIGNKFISNTKVKEFVNLETEISYTQKQISEAFELAFCSQLFSVIYPRVISENGKTILKIVVEESQTKSLGIGAYYNIEEDLVVSSTLQLTNTIQRNSKLLVNFKLGGKAEINIDYVKNYGKFYGAYFRIFPYIRERKSYTYNNLHEVQNSIGSVEGGLVCGLGFFSLNAIIAELYGYGIKNKLYQHIADFEEDELFITGVGIKAYHESLDDLLFPSRGGSLFTKISFDRKELYSDQSKANIYSKLVLAIPFNDLSLKYSWEIGSQESQISAKFSPFKIGGIDSFLGLLPDEMNADAFQINSISMMYNISNSIRLEFQYNALNLSNDNTFFQTDSKNMVHGFGAKLGFPNRFLPIRTALGFDEELERYFYLSIGYEFDDFFFSRK